MWSSLIKELDSIRTEDIPSQYRDVFWRVKKAGKNAIGKQIRELKLSSSSAESELRSFGGESREKGVLSARRSGMNKRFAWNFELTYVDNPRDGKDVRLDGSYLSGIVGNWSVTLGAVEKWWGPTWSSANLLSNNARPPIGIMLQRNYSDPSEVPVFNWLGPWTFNTFVADLDDDRSVEDSKLIGASFNFKPVDSLEIALRSTALWAGKSRAKSFNSFLDSILATEVCEEGSSGFNFSCNGYYSQNGNRIGGIDLKWRLPVPYPVSIYASSYTEEEDRFISDKSIKQLGVTSSIKIGDTHIKWFAESSDTTLDDEYNIVYENPVFQTGYRHHNLSIGSSYDNDSVATSLGFIASLDRYNKVSFTLADIELNRDGSNVQYSNSGEGGNALTVRREKFKQAKIKWQFQTRNYGRFDFIANVLDEEFGSYRSGLRVIWSYRLNK